MKRQQILFQITLSLHGWVKIMKMMIWSFQNFEKCEPHFQKFENERIIKHGFCFIFNF